MNNYLPFISNNTNSNFVCGTFGYDEKYISSLQSSLTINFLQDISNAYYGQPYLFVSAGSRGSFGFHDYSWGLLPLVMRRWVLKSILNTLNCTPGFPRPAEAGNRGRPLASHCGEGLGETVEKETAGNRHLRRDGSGYMYLDWIIVTYGVPYVISLS